MPSSSAIASIRTAKSREFGTEKMFAAGASVPAAAINAYLVNKIAFFDGHNKYRRSKDTVRRSLLLFKKQKRPYGRGAFHTITL